jgi:hypothetical protein
VLWHYIIIGLICLIAGFWLGGRHGRYVKRNAVRELNTNSLDLLESKSKFSGIESKYADYQRKDELLQLSQEQLKRSNAQAKLSTALAAKSNAQAIIAEAQAVKSDAQVKKLQQDLITLSKKQKVNQTLLKLKAKKSRNLAIQSHEKAVKATSLARKATAHLKQLENAMTSGQSISTSHSRSSDDSDSAKLSVIKSTRARSGEEIVKQVSTLDSARLAKLSSSNEATGPFKLG